MDGWGPIACVLAAAAVSVATRAMTVRGAAMGVPVGLALAWGLGWPGFTMLLAFVLVGTVLSRASARRRGPLQALCNGAVAAAAGIAAIAGFEHAAVVAAAAIATALSDTLAGEVGQRSGRPRLLLFGPRVARGADGGMTLLGTAAGAVAAPLVPLVGRLFGAPFSGNDVAWIACAAFLGNLADSVIGAFVQPHLGRSGNDWTNLLATAVGAAIAIFIV
ncbi:MAG: DUF92 domain-containing protein [Planctomycetota bacterium]|nr:DUF92 domain-containing protein [Planctomycetota bacterium]